MREPVLVVVPLLVLCLLFACARWVLLDARAHASRGHPVAVYVGNLELTRPETWAGGCLLLWAIFFPLYLVARSES